MATAYKIRDHEKDCDDAVSEYVDLARDGANKTILRALEFYKTYGLEVMVRPVEEVDPPRGPLKHSPGGIKVTACPFEDGDGCTKPAGKGMACGSCSRLPKPAKKKK